jgi:hypothetical protein
MYIYEVADLIYLLDASSRFFRYNSIDIIIHKRTYTYCTTTFIYIFYFLFDRGAMRIEFGKHFATLFPRWERQFCIGTVLLLSLLFPNIFTHWMLK